MQALESLAAVYATFEKAGENLNVENAAMSSLRNLKLPSMRPSESQERAREKLYDA